MDAAGPLTPPELQHIRPMDFFRELPQSLYVSVLYREPIRSATALETHTERKPIRIHRRCLPYSRACINISPTDRPYRVISLEAHAGLLFKYHRAAERSSNYCPT